MDFINARIVTCEDRDYECGYLSVGDGIITAIGEMTDYQPDGSEVIDLQGKSIYPGFIDAHTHLGMWEDGIGFEGEDGNEKSDPITPQLRAIDAVNSFDRCFSEAAAAGVTAVVTGPGSANAICGQAACIKTATDRIDDIIVKAPVAMKMALGENPKTVYSERDEGPFTRMATAAIIREQLFLAKRYADDIAEA
ncbi:MAG: amidohydrolase, partial [Ruminococcaceae bacterium]|nr:amidohydrolase [Oscillospiraceae bacterium]